MRFKEMSKYNAALDLIPDGYNIGWLDFKSQFKSKKHDQLVLEKLKQLSLRPFVKFRHFEGCPICYKNKVYEEIDGNNVLLGVGHVAIKNKGKTFVSPDLIYHYAKEHDYDPGEEYITALINGEIID